MPQRRLFVPFTKVDVERREVFGRLTQEMVDRDGEIWDFDASIPHLKAWSDHFAKATGGKSLGNLRAMHRNISAGKLIALDINAQQKAVDIGTKVVDDAEWEKVDEGVYTGFSLGGSVVRSWRDPVDPSHKRFEVKPNEASLADYPAVPTATFEYVKLGGTVETRHFNKVAERTDVSPKSGESKYGDVEFADEKNKKYPLNTKARVRNALSRWGNKANRDKYSAEDQKTIGAKIWAAAKKMGIDVSEKAMLAGDWNKNLYDVGRLAELAQSLSWLHESAKQEREWEGDDSTVPDELLEHLEGLLDTLETMTGEECAELLEHLGATNDDDEAAKIAKLAAANGSTQHTLRIPAMPAPEKLDDQGRPYAKKYSKEHVAKIADIHEHAKAVHQLMGNAVEKTAGHAEHETLKAVHKMMGDHCDKIAGFLDEVAGESTTEPNASASGAAARIEAEDGKEKVAKSEYVKVAGERDDFQKRADKAEAEAAEWKKNAEELAARGEELLAALDVRKGQLRIVDRATDGAGSTKQKVAGSEKPPKTFAEAAKRSFKNPQIPTNMPGQRAAG